MPVINQVPRTGGGGKWELLWTNPNPTSPISSTITVQHDMAQYERVFVSIAVSTTHTDFPYLVEARKDSTYVAVNVEKGGQWISYRWFSWDNTKFDIGSTAGYVYQSGGSALGGTYGIILAVYGVKKLKLG